MRGIHMGKHNRWASITLSKSLRFSEELRNLGIIVHKSSRWFRQCTEASKKTNRILGMIKRIIISREKDVILRLHKSLVRPHLEYCAPARNPYFKEDNETLEKVQRRTTKLVKRFRDLMMRRG